MTSVDSASTVPQLPSRREGWRYLFTALVAFALGAYLNLRKPLWLAPPWLTCSPLGYALLLLAWLPLLGQALRHFTQRGLLAVLLTLIVAIGSCFCGMVFAPTRSLAEDINLPLFAGEGPLEQFNCADEIGAGRQRLYRCEWRIASSDDTTTDAVYRYLFFAPVGWPVMWLIESSSAREPSQYWKNPD